MTTERQRTQLLLRKYMDGQTSPEEERELAAWFAAHRDEPDADFYLTMLTPTTDEAELERILTEDHTAAFDAELQGQQRARTLYIIERIAIAAMLVLAVGIAWYAVGHHQDTAPTEAPLIAMNDHPHEARPAAPVVAAPQEEAETQPAPRSEAKPAPRMKAKAKAPVQSSTEEPVPLPEPTPEPTTEDIQPQPNSEEGLMLMAERSDPKARMYIAEQIMQARASLQQKEHEMMAMQEVIDLTDQIKALEAMQQQESERKAQKEEQEKMRISI
ncbi:MAG: hypothetical protein IJ244_06870 [Bacteroidaceae bacterium]|nr:hypothetical protein [Bacteroidaceae bacterium]